MGTHPIFESDFDCLTDWRMELTWLYTALALLVATLIFLLRAKKPEEQQQEQQQQQRRQPRRLRQNQHEQRGNDRAVAEDENADIDNDAAEQQGAKRYDDDGKKIGAKKARKLEEKEQKRLQREQMERDREEDRQRREERDEHRRKRDEEEERAEKEQEEEEERLEEERLERERIEYENMKLEFEIEDEGEDVVSEDEQRKQIELFIEYIKANKVCYVDALASEFGMRNAEAVDRINRLMEMEQLTGVLDDRGKFIYITPDELASVAKWIKAKGRVTIDELQKESNRLIKL